MTSRCFSERSKILVIVRHYLVAVICEQDDGRVDDVGEARGRQKPPRGPPKRLVEGLDIYPSEGLRQTGLPRATAPHLPEHTSVCARRIPLKLSGFEPDPHGAFVALQRDERSAVKNEAHADFALRLAL